MSALEKFMKNNIENNKLERDQLGELTGGFESLVVVDEQFTTDEITNTCPILNLGTCNTIAGCGVKVG